MDAIASDRENNGHAGRQDKRRSTDAPALSRKGEREKEKKDDTLARDVRLFLFITGIR